MKVDGQNDTLRVTNPETYKDLKSLFRRAIFSCQWVLVVSTSLRSLILFKLTCLFTTKKIYVLYEFQQKRVQRNWLLIYCYFTIQINITVLIKGLCNFYCFLRSVRYRSYLILQRNCFWLCYDGVAAFDEDVERCKDHSPALVRMPSENSNIYKFNNWSALWFAPC